MQGRPLDVLLALLPADRAEPVGGDELVERLSDAGRKVSASSLLTTLLGLEASGHVSVQRDPYRFALTAAGEASAHELAPGHRVALQLVMVDLVDYVAYTAMAGDAAAHRATTRLCDAAAAALERGAGWLVKGLGDGFLAALDPAADVVAFVRRVKRHATRDDGTAWPVRAAAHLGTPIRHRNDVFGADVNLVARLCDAARPDELVLSLVGAGGGDERLGVRGLDTEVAVRRVVLA